jgi:Xaa-Pro aminopeptidase
MNKIEILQKRLPEGVDAFLTTDSVTRFYLTGFKSSNGFLFVTKSGAHFFTDFRYIEAAEK